MHPMLFVAALEKWELHELRHVSPHEKVKNVMVARGSVSIMSYPHLCGGKIVSIWYGKKMLQDLGTPRR